MSNSKPVLRAVIVPLERLALCDGCYFYTPEGFTCNVGGACGVAAPAQCCNFHGNGESVIFKEVAREPVCNSA